MSDGRAERKRCKMRLLFLYLKNKKSNIIQVVLAYVVLLLVIWLYNLPYYEAFSFGIELYGALYIVYLIYDYSVFADKIRTLERNIKTDDIQNIALPDKKNDVEALYADIIIKLHEQKRKQYDAGVEASRNLKDYYACWAHQIKTPIAAAKLIIQSLGDVVPIMSVVINIMMILKTMRVMKKMMIMI